ncbi:hypothetical protein, partial [Psychrobacter sp. NPDC078501]|uniref:hypothetical protein n=1 Tax=Psychrobacter sp. NPDC078501 TaxID=3364495 RepID=UPI0038513AF5
KLSFYDKVGWRIIYLNYFIIWVVLLLFWIDYSLSNLHIKETEKDSIEEQVIGSISSELGEFMLSWNKLESNIRSWAESKYPDTETSHNRPFRRLISFLHDSKFIDSSLFFKLIILNDDRNRIVHLTKGYSKKDIEEINASLQSMLIQFEQFIKN